MYQYKYNNQNYSLVEARDMVVVRTAGAEDLKEMNVSSESRNLIPCLIPVTAFPEANVTVYKIIEKDHSKVLSLRNTIRKQLSSEDNIRYAGRVLKDPKTSNIFVYTENLFVKFKEGTTKKKCKEILKSYKLVIAEELVFAPKAYFVKGKEGLGLKVFELADSLLQLDEMENCHPELVGQKKHKSIYPVQWHLKRAVINGRVIDQHINIEQAWAHTKGEGTIIAIVDDGVDVDHPEFSSFGKVVAPRNTVRNTNDARPIYSSENHGTACAGVACADGTDKASGVAPSAKLMPIKTGGLGSIAEAKAFSWAADNGADVISCSWGPVDGLWWNPSDILHHTNVPLPDSTRYAIDYALTRGRDGKGCIIVWAGGNGNESIDYDGYASYPKVIAVAACNDRGKRSIYSDYGQAIWCSFPSSDQGYSELNHPSPLTAGIWTTDRQNNRGYNEGGVDAEEFIGDRDGNYTATFGGTSSSCPGMAGVVALMLAVNPDLNWEQVKEIIKNSCDQIDSNLGNYDASGHSPYYGYGRINAEKAVLNAIAASQDQIVELSVKGLANFNKNTDVPIVDSEWIGQFDRANRLLGFQLNIDPFQPELALQYQVKFNKRSPDPVKESGEFAGTRDRRRKIIGFNISLIGAQADQYEVLYEAKLKGEDDLAEGKDGSVCGTFANTGDAIEQIKITIRRIN